MPRKGTQSRKRAEAASPRRGSGGPALLRYKGKHRKKDDAWIAANTHIVRYYPIGCIGGTPRRLTLDSRDIWIVPIVLTSPGYGPVGECGVVALDARTLAILDSSPRDEVGAAIVHLREIRRDELEAAFQKARTV